MMGAHSTLFTELCQQHLTWKLIEKHNKKHNTGRERRGIQKKEKELQSTHQKPKLFAILEHLDEGRWGSHDYFVPYEFCEGSLAIFFKFLLTIKSGNSETILIRGYFFTIMAGWYTHCLCVPVCNWKTSSVHAFWLKVYLFKFMNIFKTVREA